MVDGCSVVSAQSWSLDDCMKYAVEHATDVKRETINARQRKQDYNMLWLLSCLP